MSREVIKGTQLDTSFMKSHNISGKINYSHKFESRPDARLDITLSEMTGINADAKRRITSGAFYSAPKNYATYSNLNDFNTELSAGIIWRINDRHRLALNYGRTISRPDWNQLHFLIL